MLSARKKDGCRVEETGNCRTESKEKSDVELLPLLGFDRLV